jgi:hypothetical protein
MAHDPGGGGGGSRGGICLIRCSELHKGNGYMKKNVQT